MRRSNMMRWGAGVGLCLLLAGAVAVVPRLWADMIVTDSDTQYEGDVLSDDKNMIIFQTDRGILYYRRDQLKAIMYTRFPKSSATVQEIVGKAEFERKDRPGWKELIVGAKLRPGDKIRTGDASRVIATVAGQAVMAVEANSELTVTDVSRNDEGDVRVRLDLDEGQLWNDVGMLASAKSKYIVETPQASCGVRGTVYSVVTSELEQETTVATLEGEVTVIQKREGADPVSIGANQQSRFQQEGDIETTVVEASFVAQWGAYSKRFSRMRARMQLEEFFDRYGLTPEQGYMASAGAGGVLILFVGIVIIRRLKK